MGRRGRERTFVHLKVLYKTCNQSLWTMNPEKGIKKKDRREKQDHGCGYMQQPRKRNKEKEHTRKIGVQRYTLQPSRKKTKREQGKQRKHFCV